MVETARNAASDSNHRTNEIVLIAAFVFIPGLRLFTRALLHVTSLLQIPDLLSKKPVKLPGIFAVIPPTSNGAIPLGVVGLGNPPRSDSLFAPTLPQAIDAHMRRLLQRLLGESWLPWWDPNVRLKQQFIPRSIHGFA